MIAAWPDSSTAWFVRAVYWWLTGENGVAGVAIRAALPESHRYTNDCTCIDCVHAES